MLKVKRCSMLTFIILFFILSLNSFLKAESEMRKRLKIQVKNDSTILIYAYKTDVKEILTEIDHQTYKYKFVYESTISGISPEISFQKEDIDIALNSILEKNILYKEKNHSHSSSRITVFTIKKGPPPHIKIDPSKLSLEEKLKYRFDSDIFQNTLQELKEKSKVFLPDLIRLLKGDDKKLRKISAYILGEVSNQDAIPALFAGLESESALDHKMIIAEALLKMNKFHTQISPLAMNLYNTKPEDDPTKIAAMIIYAKINSNNKNIAKGMFLDSIGSTNVRLRMRAAIFLSLEGNKSIKNTVIESLNDSDASIRKLALEALGNLKDMEMIPTFKDFLIDSDPEVRNAARFAIKKVEYANIVGHATGDNSKIDFLRYTFVNEASREVKIWAGKELISLGKSGMRALEDISAKEEYGEIALLAAKILDLNDK